MSNSKPEVVVVTGASAGVGRATVCEFARHGAHIGLLARGRDGLEGAKNDVERLGGKALICQTDVSDAAQVEAAADAVERELGPIDIWVNDAMVSVFAPVMEIKPEEYKRVTEVTYLGQVYGAQAALRRMKPRNRGKIVFVGSALAYRGIPLQSAYCGAKHAIQGFFDSLRCELLHYKSGITITMVNLPGINTPQFEWSKSRMPRNPKPLGKVFQPEVPARAIYWAAHNDRREVDVAWPVLKAIEGNKVAPGYADHVLAEIGFAGQQTDQPTSPDRKDNLWEPLPGDYGAHGPFNAQAHDRSPELWASLHRGLLAVAGAGLAGLAAGSMLMGGRNHGD